MSEVTQNQRKPRRVFMWTFLAIQALFLLWVITGLMSQSGDCTGLSGLAAHNCAAASDAGHGVAVAIQVVLWGLVDVILGVGRWVVVSARRKS